MALKSSPEIGDIRETLIKLSLHKQTDFMTMQKPDAYFFSHSLRYRD